MIPAAAVPGRMPGSRADVARARTRDEALALVDAESLIQPATAFRVWPVRCARDEGLDLGTRSLAVPGFSGYAGEISAVAAAACTLGPRLERRVAALFHARRRLLALELDAIGTERLFALADRLAARIRRAAGRAGLRASATLHPGDAGMSLGEQQAVLALAGTGAQGIGTTAAGMLRPVKSLAFVVALGRGVPAAAGARCDRCGARDRCRIRPT
jgi:hypothetical protein